MERLDDLGEIGLIERLRARIPITEGVEIGPGDDAAALRTTGLTLASTDILIEGVHFDLTLSSPSDVGYKSLAVNVSDIAAMGGRARYALVCLGVPPDTPVASIDAFGNGLSDAGTTFGVALAGGDLAHAPQWIASVAILGEPHPAGIIRRSGARAGDVLCVTGSLGAAAAGLALLREGIEKFPKLAEAHRRGQARAREGIAAAAAGATAMIDVSDGLARDASHIARASGVGVEIRAASVPLAEGVEEAADFLGADSVAFALSGGEDYELAIAIPAAQVEALARAIAPTPLTPVGEFCGAEHVLVRDGARFGLDEMGFDHFR